MKELFRTTSPDGANVQSFVFSSAATPSGKNKQRIHGKLFKKSVRTDGRRHRALENLTPIRLEKNINHQRE